MFQKADTLYFPGCMTDVKYKEHYDLYKKIFSKLGLKVIWSENVICCGLPALEMGYENEARKLARKKFELLKENNIKKIVTNCSGCYKMFKQNYPEVLPDWDIEVLDIWRLVLDRLLDKQWLIKNIAGETVTYDDSCYLGRYCGIYDEPRRILDLIGYKVEEMSDSKENAICSGGCGSLPIINLQLADEIARQRLLQAKRKGIKKMIVASMKDYDLLKKNGKELGIEVIELSEAIAKALDIWVDKINEEVKPKEENEEENEIDEETAKKMKDEEEINKLIGENSNKL